MSRQWKTSIIISVIILIIGGFGVYKYRDYCIINAVQNMCDMDPTANIHVTDFKTVEEYSAYIQEVQYDFEEKSFKIIADKFWTTPEHAKELYIDYIIKKYK